VKGEDDVVYDLLLVAATKLNMEAVPLASASTIYHKFFQRFHPSTWDPYVSTYNTSLSLLQNHYIESGHAGSINKLGEHPVNISSKVNFCLLISRHS